MSEQSDSEQSEPSQKLNRRDFLKFWRSFFPTRSVLTSPETQANVPSLTRRQFVKFLLTAGASLAASRYPGISHYLGIEPAEEDQLLPKPRQEESMQKEPTLADTAVISALYSLSELISLPIIKALKIPVGTAGSVCISDEMMRADFEAHLYKTLLSLSVVDPMTEEVIFRALPSFITDVIKGQSREVLWEVGIPVAGIFALYHNVGKDKDTEKTIFVRDKIPLRQFAGGLFFWYLMRERGFPHAVVAHSITNSIPFTLGKMLYDVLPPKSCTEVSKEATNQESIQK